MVVISTKEMCVSGLCISLYFDHTSYDFDHDATIVLLSFKRKEGEMQEKQQQLLCLQIRKARKEKDKERLHLLLEELKKVQGGNLSEKELITFAIKMAAKVMSNN